MNASSVCYAIGGVRRIAVAAGDNQLFGFRQGDTQQVYALPNR